MSLRSPRVFRTPLTVLCAALILGACARAPISGPVSPVRVVVLDALVPPGHGQDDGKIEGWWMTARDVYRDPNDGLHWGNLLSEAMAKTIPNLTVHSRLDLLTYLATKEELLEKSYPDLEKEEVRRLLAEQSPVDFGRSLGADFVVSSRIEDAWLSHHRTFHWWSGVAKGEVDVWDVSRGEKIWSWGDRDRGFLRSVYSVMKGMAWRCARDAGRAGVFSTVRAVAPAPESK